MTDLADLTALSTRTIALYAQRFGTPHDSSWLLHKLTEELGEVHSAWLAQQGHSRPKTAPQDLANEVADLLGFLLVFAAQEGIDPAKALHTKWGAYGSEPKDDP